MYIYSFFDSATVTMFAHLGAAMLCGMVLGTERIIAHKAAGVRTYALASMGAAFFMIVAQLVLGAFPDAPSLGLFYVVAAVVSGIGFMGAGVIMVRGTSVTGVTTASGLWVAAGIGMACGFGFILPAFMVTVLTLFIFVVLWRLEQRIRMVYPEDVPEA